MPPAQPFVDPVYEALLQRREEISKELTECAHEFDNLAKLNTLLKFNSLILKNILGKILKKTDGGAIFKWNAHKLYRYMFGLFKNMTVARLEFRASNNSPAIALSIERQLRETREKVRYEFLDLTIMFSDYIDEDLLPYDELKDELILFAEICDDLTRITTAYAVTVLKRADLNMMYEVKPHRLVYFHTEDRHLLLYVREHNEEEFADFADYAWRNRA